MSFDGYYTGADKYITQYIKDFDATYKDSYDWNNAYEVIQRIGFEYYKQLINAMFDLDDIGFAGGFIAHPVVDSDGALLEDAIVISSDGDIAFVKAGTIVKGDNDIYLDNSQISESSTVRHSKDGMSIVQTLPYAQSISEYSDDPGDGYTLLSDSNGNYNILEHRLNIVAENTDYINELSDAILTAEEQNSVLNAIYNGLNKRISYGNTGILHTEKDPGIVATLSSTTVTLTFTKKLYYSSITQDRGSYIYRIPQSLAKDIEVETSSGVGFSAKWNLYKVYLQPSQDNSIPYGAQITEDDITYEEVSHTVKCFPEQNYMSNLGIMSANNNLLGYLLVGKNHAYFWPQYMLPQDIRQTVIWVPPYYSTLTTTVPVPNWENGWNPVMIEHYYLDSNHVSVDNIKYPLPVHSKFTPAYINVYGLQQFSKEDYLNNSGLYPLFKCSYYEVYSASDVYGDMTNTADKIYIGMSELPGYTAITDPYYMGVIPDYSPAPSGANKSASEFTRIIQPAIIELHTDQNGSKRWYINMGHLYDALYGAHKSLSGDIITPLRSRTNRILTGASLYSFPYFVSILWSRGGLNDSKLDNNV